MAPNLSRVPSVELMRMEEQPEDGQDHDHLVATPHTNRSAHTNATDTTIPPIPERKGRFHLIKHWSQWVLVGAIGLAAIYLVADDLADLYLYFSQSNQDVKRFAIGQGVTNTVLTAAAIAVFCFACVCINCLTPQKKLEERVEELGRLNESLEKRLQILEQDIGTVEKSATRLRNGTLDLENALDKSERRAEILEGKLATSTAKCESTQEKLVELAAQLLSLQEIIQTQSTQFTVQIKEFKTTLDTLSINKELLEQHGDAINAEADRITQQTVSMSKQIEDTSQTYNTLVSTVSSTLSQCTLGLINNVPEMEERIRTMAATGVQVASAAQVISQNVADQRALIGTLKGLIQTLLVRTDSTTSIGTKSEEVV